MAENTQESQARVDEMHQRFADIDAQITALREEKAGMQEEYAAALEDHERLVREERLAEVGGSNGEQVVAVNTVTEEGEASNG